MKLRYVVTYYVDGEGVDDALKKIKRMKPHEVYIHNAWWEKKDFSLKEEKRKEMGFKHRKPSKAK